MFLFHMCSLVILPPQFTLVYKLFILKDNRIVFGKLILLKQPSKSFFKENTNPVWTKKLWEQKIIL